MVGRGCNWKKVSQGSLAFKGILNRLQEAKEEKLHRNLGAEHPGGEYHTCLEEIQW